MSASDLSPRSVRNEAAVGLPSLNDARSATWDLYRLEFLPDGYPGRRTGEMLSAHPIYGTYVIADYVAQYRATRNDEYLVAARRVADAAISRMESRGDALVFMYEPDMGLSTLPGRFYSGLTQARYLQALGALYRAGADARFLDAAEAVLHSLTIPVEAGGVTRATPSGGLLIEEYTHEVPDYTLNGWTTATILIDDYSKISPTDDAAALVDASRRGIRDVLPLYDVPELRNSRYRLGGPARVQLTVPSPGCRMSDMGLVVPAHGTYPVHQQARIKWQSGFLGGVADDGVVTDEAAVLELFLCRASWPEPNRLIGTLRAQQDGELTAAIGEGTYNPLQTILVPQKLTTFATIQVRRGVNELDIPIPWHLAELVAYPTSFGKRLAQKWHNQYHFIHVDTLRKLVAREPDAMFSYYAERWAQYPGHWPEMQIYTDADITLHRFGENPNASGSDAPGVPAVDRHGRVGLSRWWRSRRQK